MGMSERMMRSGSRMQARGCPTKRTEQIWAQVSSGLPSAVASGTEYTSSLWGSLLTSGSCCVWRRLQTHLHVASSKLGWEALDAMSLQDPQRQHIFAKSCKMFVLKSEL